MTIGKFIRIHYQESPIFIHVDHIVKVTQIENYKASITLDNKEEIVPDETYFKVVSEIENITCFYTGE